MAGNVPFRTYSTSDFIKRFSNVALTAQFRAIINIQNLPFTSSYAPSNRYTEDLSILCAEASLPGSSFSTSENNQDYYGIGQKYAYRKDFDTVNMTFYVDTNYTNLKFFEQWMDYISSPDLSYSTVGQNIANTNSFYRFKYPEGPGGYKTNLDIHKFNKDFEPVTAGAGFISGTGNKADIVYSFVNAFPTNIASMPVSYEASSLLKVTVTFSYDRYYVNRAIPRPIQQGSQDPQQSQPYQLRPGEVPITGPLDTQATAGDDPRIPAPSVNPDSSFRSNLDKVTEEDRRLIEEERQLTRDSLQLF
jgi:hypothetical protein